MSADVGALPTASDSTSPCPTCGQGVSSAARFCPGCGTDATAGMTPATSVTGDVGPAMPPAQVRAATPVRRRRAPRLAMALVLTLVAAAATAYGVTGEREKTSIDAALIAAHADVRSTLRTAAEPGTSLAGAADAFDALGGRLEDERARAAAARPSPLRDVATDLFEAHVGLAEALASVRTLRPDTLHQWAAVRSDVLTAAEAVEEAADVFVEEPRFDDEVGDMLSATEDKLARSLIDDVDPQAIKTISGLGTSAALQHVRDWGTAVAATHGDLDKRTRLFVGGGADEPSAARTDLSNRVQLLEAFVPLSSLQPADLGTWPDVRTGIMERLEAVAPAAPGTPHGDALVAAVHKTVGALDTLIGGWAASFEGWRAQFDAEQQRQIRDERALARHVTAVEGALRRYAALREETSDYFATVARTSSGSYSVYDRFDAARFFDEAATERSALAASLRGLRPAPPLVHGHGLLVNVIQYAADVMRNGSDALYDAGCFYSSCVLPSMSGWQYVSSQSSVITTRFSEAEATWRAAVTAVRGEITSRPMPAAPSF